MIKREKFIGYSNNKFDVFKKRKVSSFYKAGSKESTSLTNNSYEKPFLEGNLMSLVALYEDLQEKLTEIKSEGKLFVTSSYCSDTKK